MSLELLVCGNWCCCSGCCCVCGWSNCFVVSGCSSVWCVVWCWGVKRCGRFFFVWCRMMMVGVLNWVIGLILLCCS